MFIFSIHAGVGGIAGGTDKYQVGDKILFQSDSRQISVLYSKTLCHNAYDFEATVKKCLTWTYERGNKTCVEHYSAKIYQPKESTKERCVSYREGDCSLWKEQLFIQSPKRIVQIKDKSSNEIKLEKKVIVPHCYYKN